MLFLLSATDVLSVLSQILSYVLAFFVLMFMVVVHELGHYTAGRLLDFRIIEFSVGMGPKIFSIPNKKTGEIFSLRWLPLGGYCAFDGEETDADTDKRAFNNQKPWKRIIVLLAGVTFNFICALLLAVIVFACYGDYLPQIKNVETSSPNYSILLADDVIYAVDGKTLYLANEVSEKIALADDNFTLTVLRNGEKVELSVVKYDFTSVTENGEQTIHGLGISMAYTSERVRFTFGEAVGRSFGYCGYVAAYVLRILGSLITGALSLDSVGGPISTIAVTGQVISTGFANVLLLIVLISVNLAVFNLLPVPALDGCQIIFVLIEWISGKPINRKVQNIINTIGIVLLFAFAILVDILKL